MLEHERSTEHVQVLSDPERRDAVVEVDGVLGVYINSRYDRMVISDRQGGSLQREKEPGMKITNQKLLADAAEIVSTEFFLNEETGEIRQGVAYSHLMNRLRDYKYNWKNVSNITESDFEDSGFTLLTKYSRNKTPWIALESEYSTGKIRKGRRVARTTWIVANSNTISWEALESNWVANHEQYSKERALYKQLADEIKSAEMTDLRAQHLAYREAEAKAKAAFPKIPLEV